MAIGIETYLQDAQNLSLFFQDELLISNAESMDPKNWILIAEQIPGRTNRECKRRWAQLQRSSDSRSRAPWTKEVCYDIHFSGACMCYGVLT